MKALRTALLIVAAMVLGIIAVAFLTSDTIETPAHTHGGLPALKERLDEFTRLGEWKDASVRIRGGAVVIKIDMIPPRNDAYQADQYCIGIERYVREAFGPDMGWELVMYREGMTPLECSG
jgi:hypothetical protein